MTDCYCMYVHNNVTGEEFPKPVAILVGNNGKPMNSHIHYENIGKILMIWKGLLIGKLSIPNLSLFPLVPLYDVWYILYVATIATYCVSLCNYVHNI